MSRAKNWCFTLNNYTDAECTAVREALVDYCEFAVVGKEVGDSGTRHLQGYIQLIERRRRAAVCKLPGLARAYLTVSRGTVQQASDYCRKDGDILVEHGQPVTQGQRSDLDEIKEKLDQGCSISDIAEDYFRRWCTYRRSFEAYAALRIKPRDFRTQVCWYYGRPGSGKSRLAFKEASYFSNGNICSLADLQLKWFEPYRGHKAVVIDDFKGQCEISVLLRLWDRYPLQVPVKGGFVEWVPRIVFVTANYHPSVFYEGEGYSYDALLRRIDLIEEIQ